MNNFIVYNVPRLLLVATQNNRIMKKRNSKLLIRNLRKMEENKQLNIGGVIISGCDKDLCEHNTGIPLNKCQYSKCLLKS